MRNIESALTALEENGEVQVIRRSKYYETSPVEFLNQPYFINNVVEISTALTSTELLDRIRGVEKIHNPNRKIPKGPRVVDLDILLYKDEIKTSDSLTIPHPAACKRRFVLVPLLELAPKLHCPTDQRPFAECLKEINDPTQVIEVYHG